MPHRDTSNTIHTHTHTPARLSKQTRSRRRRRRRRRYRISHLIMNIYALIFACVGGCAANVPESLRSAARTARHGWLSKTLQHTTSHTKKNTQLAFMRHIEEYLHPDKYWICCCVRYSSSFGACLPNTERQVSVACFISMSACANLIIQPSVVLHNTTYSKKEQPADRVSSSA